MSAEKQHELESVKSVEDDDTLKALGYEPTFKREFKNLATISFAFSIMAVCSSVATTLNTPLLLGGPASVVWCWIIGSVMCLTLGASIAELVSAYPTAGALYTASAQLVPPERRAIVGWIVGWLNMLGQIAGAASTEFGLSSMIWAAVVVAHDGNYVVTQGKVFGLFVALLIVHGILNSFGTKVLARLTSSFVFVNLGASILIIIALLACTKRSDMHSAKYLFAGAGVINQTGGWNDGVAFLLGLLSVQWTMTDYDATAHISEEVKRAAVAAPVAIFVAVIGTGLIGWVLNIVLVLCSGPIENLPGSSGLAMIEIMYLRIGKAGTLFLWAWVCLTAFFCVQVGTQASSRTFYAFSRDHGFPDRGILGRVSKKSGTPLFAVWFVTVLAALPGLLDLASPIAAQAIFALTAVALDISYIVPIFCRRFYRNHPGVNFKPGPFYMPGLLGWAANCICIMWTLFVTVILSLPTIRPITAQNFNYAAVITAAILILSGLWYILGGRKHYKGPISNVQHSHIEHDRPLRSPTPTGVATLSKEEKS